MWFGTVFLIEAMFTGTVLYKFREIRSLFPELGFGPGQSVGFSQFDGYPLHFELFIFLILFTLPVFVTFIFFRPKYGPN